MPRKTKLESRKNLAIHRPRHLARRILGCLAILLLPAAAHARSSLLGDYQPGSCTSGGSTSELRTPMLGSPLYEGDTAVRILNQAALATIQVQKLGTGAIMGPVATKDSAYFALGTTLAAGDQIRACQTHTLPIAASVCGEWIEVATAPTSLEAPRFIYLVVYSGARAIAVGGIHPGAEVVVEIGGVEHRRRWAGRGNAVSLPVDETLPVGTQLDVYQTVNGVTSPTTSMTIAAGTRTLVAPRILGPVQGGDLGVWVTHVTPGSLVEIVSAGSGVVLGSKEVGESMAMIPTCAVDGDVYARATRNGNAMTSATVALSSLGSPGLANSEGDFDFGTMNTTDQNNVPKKGRWYSPFAIPFGIPSPVVFFMHGAEPTSYCDLPGVGGDPFNPPFEGDSYLGYEYLADDLARRGFWVFSIAVEPSDLAVESRLELLAEVVDDVLNHGYTGVGTDSPLGFLGHSLGGDTVITYATTASSTYDVRGVLAIAPASWAIRDPLGLDPPNGVALLHVQGSDDGFFGSPGTDFLRSIHHYDTAWKAKTQVFVKGAGHDCFNACWCLTTPTPGALTEAQHQEVVSLLARPFFYGLLKGSPEEWAPYYKTHVRPKGLYQYELYMQHHAPAGAYLIDNFGDPQGELFVDDDNQDVLVNSRGGAVFEQNPAVAFEELTHGDMETSLGVTYHAEHLTDNRALVLEWDSYDYEYVSKIPLFDPLSVAPTDFLAFRIMAVPDDPANDLAGEEGYEQDLVVILRDALRQARVRVGSAGPVTYPYLSPYGHHPPVFATVRIPIDAFTAVRPNLNLNNIRSVRIKSKMRDRGRVIIDDLEIMRK